jgi:hypothetical protein
MKAIFLLVAAIMLTITMSYSQTNTQKANQAVDKATEKVDNVEQGIRTSISKVEVLRDQAKTALQTVKDLTKVFDPVVWLHGKNKQYDVSTASEIIYQQGNYTPPADHTGTANEQYTPYTDPALSNYYVTPESFNSYTTSYTPEDARYNADGTANLGSQNHTSFGCYLDIMRGTVMDEIDAATDPQNVDLIFTATDYFNASVPMYAFLTPSYAKYDKFAYNFFKGTKYNDQKIPPLNWEIANESEVAFAPITGEQFEKIQNNKQLMAIVKMISNFSGKIESRTKLDGKVVAIKTTMGDRTAYGLMHIVNHYGTTGPNGYLKVKIKVLGFDASGNGYPDPFVYQY